MFKKINKAGILFLILGSLFVLATVLSLFPGPLWWVRIFDYPRLQVAVLGLIAIGGSVFFLPLKPKVKIAWLLLLGAAFLYQAGHIAVYTPFFPKQVLKNQQTTGQNSVSLLVSNVLMDNRNTAGFLELVRTHRPDIILLTEPDSYWEQQLQVLDKEYAYSIKKPLQNTYGMLLYSKLPLQNKALNYLVEADIPSVYAQVKLPSGQLFDFYGLHPRPPMPGTDTYERDAEILLVGKKVRKRNKPTIVAGDLNDVAWSYTSGLFQRYSGLLDPRHGRGIYNTFNAKIPLLRYPLDHVFISDDFAFIDMQRLDNFGSDHFPILLKLNFQPQTDNSQDEPEADSDDVEEANEKIDEGK